MTRKLWLTGDTLDLGRLAAALPIGDAQVIKDGDRFYMISEEADNVADAQVPEITRKLVTRINGIGRLQNANFRPIEFADTYEDHAGVTVVGATATLSIGSGVTAEAVVLDADGNVVQQSPPPGPGCLAIAATNRDVAEVLQILGQPELPNFAELYKIGRNYQIRRAARGRDAVRGRLRRGTETLQADSRPSGCQRRRLTARAE